MIRCEAGEVDIGVSDKDIKAIKENSVLRLLYGYFCVDKSDDEIVENVRSNILSADLSIIFRSLIDTLGKEQGLKTIVTSVDRLQQKIEEGEI